MLIFLSTILIFVIGSEILIRGSLKSSVNTHKELKQKLDSSVKSIALFADSRGANGIIENEKIANFSLAGLNLKSLINLAEYHMTKNKVSGIIIQLDPHQFSTYRLTANQNKLLSELLLDESHNFYFLKPQYKQYLTQYWVSFFDNMFAKKINNLQNENKNKILKKTEIRVQMQTPLENIENTIEYKLLKSLIRKMKNKNIEVCLVSFPVNNLYRQFSNTRIQFLNSKKLFYNLASNYNVIYRDFGNILTDDLFSDSDHLNKEGSIFLLTCYWKNVLEKFCESCNRL